MRSYDKWFNLLIFSISEDKTCYDYMIENLMYCNFDLTNFINAYDHERRCRYVFIFSLNYCMEISTNPIQSKCQPKI